MVVTTEVALGLVETGQQAAHPLGVLQAGQLNSDRGANSAEGELILMALKKFHAAVADVVDEADARLEEVGKGRRFESLGGLRFLLFLSLPVQERRRRRRRVVNDAHCVAAHLHQGAKALQRRVGRAGEVFIVDVTEEAVIVGDDAV